ncbi:helix-turn-helix domain-containing protein [Thiomonas intermedia]|uniref:helix-turn-helix domain-containing protein n=1 Tax=Thiomonas intermedia TaxID=926 RepID=UPI0009A55164|nr:helix-turn-helix domain-containing protein [Thiomonas intermedia]
MTQPQHDSLLTVRAVQDLTQLSRTTLHRLCRAGHLHPIHIGRSLRFSSVEITAFMQVGVSSTDRPARR